MNNNKVQIFVVNHSADKFKVSNYSNLKRCCLAEGWNNDHRDLYWILYPSLKKSNDGKNISKRDITYKDLNSGSGRTKSKGRLKKLPKDYNKTFYYSPDGKIPSEISEKYDHKWKNNVLLLEKKCDRLIMKEVG